jgi:hypothetical protein
MGAAFDCADVYVAADGFDPQIDIPGQAETNSLVRIDVTALLLMANREPARSLLDNGAVTIKVALSLTGADDEDISRVTVCRLNINRAADGFDRDARAGPELKAASNLLFERQIPLPARILVSVYAQGVRHAYQDSDQEAMSYGNYSVFHLRPHSKFFRSSSLFLLFARTSAVRAQADGGLRIDLRGQKRVLKIRGRRAGANLRAERDARPELWISTPLPPDDPQLNSPAALNRFMQSFDGSLDGPRSRIRNRDGLAKRCAFVNGEESFLRCYIIQGAAGKARFPLRTINRVVAAFVVSVSVQLRRRRLMLAGLFHFHARLFRQ